MMKQIKANRIKPGDRWSIIDDENNIIYESLTECLNEIFIKTSSTYFEIDAKMGNIYIDDGNEKPPVRYSMYGEEVDEQPDLWKNK